MDFYLTMEDGSSWCIPLNPEKVTLSIGPKMETHASIALGDLITPRGKQPDKVKWDGIFPGANLASQSFIKQWISPKDWIDRLKQASDNGEKMRLLVTETSINVDVYINSFDGNWSGGSGDSPYSIEFIEAREIKIRTVDSLGNTMSIQSLQSLQSRPTPPAPKIYTVKSGDTLYGIAKSQLSDSSRWSEIYNLNRSLIGPNPDVIYPGQIYNLPA